VLFWPEPGACGGRIDPGQDIVAPWLVSILDYHVFPSASPYAATDMARTLCEHIDYALIHEEQPELFRRRAQVGIPALPDLWEARRVLADHGAALAFDAQWELIDDELAVAIYGAGVVGVLDEDAWNAAAALLTTCCCTIREPRDDSDTGLIRPARAPGRSPRPVPTRVRPVSAQAGDWVHTWWAYPVHGTLLDDCTCSAHAATAGTAEFGPRNPRLASA
jgi:hypothetical protein